MDRTPLSDGFLPGQYEAAGAGTCEPRQARCNVLPTASLRIEQGPDRLGEIGRRGRLFAVMRMPRFEQLDDLDRDVDRRL